MLAFAFFPVNEDAGLPLSSDRTRFSFVRRGRWPGFTWACLRLALHLPGSEMFQFPGTDAKSVSEREKARAKREICFDGIRRFFHMQGFRQYGFPHMKVKDRPTLWTLDMPPGAQEEGNARWLELRACHLSQCNEPL